jgi:hypothetical protein
VFNHRPSGSQHEESAIKLGLLIVLMEEFTTDVVTHAVQHGGISSSDLLALKERCHWKVSRSQYLGADRARQQETLEAVDRELQRIIENVISRCGTPDIADGRRDIRGLD